MRVAVVSEVSARDKNRCILEALRSVGAEIFNIGMASDGSEPGLTYIHTGLIAALALNTGAADFVVGGCGTGQGFLLSVMQYPGVFCGHITEPLDAWLFSQINGGNCVSLALNKGFGWAGDINLGYIFEKLFCDESGKGYPPHRSDSQRASRRTLAEISGLTHRDFASIVRALDINIVNTAFQHQPFAGFIRAYARDGELKDLILSD
jgi:ribose 5-phosphate isomerase RpiB